MITLPMDCDYCSARNANSVFDHEPDCEFAQREANRQIERLEENLGTAWETDDTQEQLEKYRSFIERT